MLGNVSRSTAINITEVCWKWTEIFWGCGGPPPWKQDRANKKAGRRFSYMRILHLAVGFLGETVVGNRVNGWREETVRTAAPSTVAHAKTA